MVGGLVWLIAWETNNECADAIRQTTGSSGYPAYLYASLVKDCAVAADRYLFIKFASLASVPIALLAWLKLQRLLRR